MRAKILLIQQKKKAAEFATGKRPLKGIGKILSSQFYYSLYGVARGGSKDETC